MARSVDDEVLDRLDQILRVLALQATAERSVTEGVWLLKLAGLDNRTIAEVLNTSEATVRTLASNRRRREMAPRQGARRR